MALVTGMTYGRGHIFNLILLSKRFYPPARHLRPQYFIQIDKGIGLKPIHAGTGLVGIEILGLPDGQIEKSHAINLKSMAN